MGLHLPRTLSFFKSTIVVQFLSGANSLAPDWLSLFADYLWKKPFTLANVKVSANRPCHQSLWQKVRDKLSSNGQHQTKQSGLNSLKGRKEACSELINIPVSLQDKRLTPPWPLQELLPEDAL